MAKRKKLRGTIEDAERKAEKKEPKPTRVAFYISLWVIVLGLVTQFVIAVIAYPSLPERIPASWIGSPDVVQTVPSWSVFLAFPTAQVVLLLLAVFSHRDDEGRRVMESGKATSLILLAILFTILQYSAFHLI